VIAIAHTSLRVARGDPGHGDARSDPPWEGFREPSLALASAGPLEGWYAAMATDRCQRTWACPACPSTVSTPPPPRAL